MTVKTKGAKKTVEGMETSDPKQRTAKVSPRLVTGGPQEGLPESELQERMARRHLLAVLDPHLSPRPEDPHQLRAGSTQTRQPCGHRANRRAQPCASVAQNTRQDSATAFRLRRASARGRSWSRDALNSKPAAGECFRHRPAIERTIPMATFQLPGIMPAGPATWAVSPERSDGLCICNWSIPLSALGALVSATSGAEQPVRRKPCSSPIPRIRCLHARC